MSTAYCHLNEKILYEKAYPPPASPIHVIKACEWMSDEILDSVTDKYFIFQNNIHYKLVFFRILGDIPNTYSFTKALGEALVVDEMDNLPVIVLRPSVGKFFCDCANVGMTSYNLKPCFFTVFC